MLLERIAVGQSNSTFFVTFDTRQLVLCKQPHGELLPSAHAIDREYRVMEPLKKVGVLVLTVVLYCADRDVIEVPFYIMDRLNGMPSTMAHFRVCPVRSAALCTDHWRRHWRLSTTSIQPVSVCRITGRAETTSHVRSRSGPGSGSSPALGKVPTSSG
jgi:hypothetical protein